MKLSYKRLVCLGAGILIAAGLSNCERTERLTEVQKKEWYERAIQNIAREGFAGAYSVGYFIQEFTEFGDYKDSPLLLPMFKALEAGEFQQYAELYAVYSPQSEPRITTDQWSLVVKDAFRQKYPSPESITDPPVYYRDLASWYKFFALSGEDALSYTSKIGSGPQLAIVGTARFGYAGIDEFIGACGADPKGKVLIFTRDDPKADNGREMFSCNLDAMAQLPEALFPYSLEEVEYTVELHYTYSNVEIYTGNIKGLRKDAEVTLRRLSDKKVIYSSKITGEPLPQFISVNRNDTYYVGKISPENIERAYGDLLAALAGKTTGGYSYIAGNGAAVIMSYTGQVRNLVIPDNLDGFPVSSINTSAFSGNSFVSVKMPSSIERIGARAFYHCEKLSAVELSKNILSIGDEAFAYCALKQVEFPEKLESLGMRAFEDNHGLEKISFLGSLKNIPNFAFSSCIDLYDITLPEGLEGIGANAFSSTYIADLIIPDSVITIGGSAFSGCEKLAAVKLPANIKSIDSSAFGQCRALKNVQFPEGLEVISRRAFAGCTSLEKITLPSTLKRLEERAFESCIGLKQTEIHIPANLERYSSNAFERCTSIRDIYFPGKISGRPVINFVDMELTENTNVTIHCRQGSSAYELVAKHGYSWVDLPED